MFDIGWPELLLVAVLVIIVVGPKDLPRVMRAVAHYVGKTRNLTREFRSHMDDMVRESELNEIKEQINAGAELDPAVLVENSIDPDQEIQDALEFADGEFDLDEEMADAERQDLDDNVAGIDDEERTGTEIAAETFEEEAESVVGDSEKVTS
ncbi:MAG: Sec-independent protein translocase protein TatB [Pseudomonadota bacterium]|nr:Sec-independent protein translocase protein TatB [Pseudomonadota bacterium]